MKDFINKIKTDFKAFVDNPRTRAILKKRLLDGCRRFAIDKLGVKLTEEELAHLSDLVS